MKREADKNRTKRAIEHIKAAITNIDSIKFENRDKVDDYALDESRGNLVGVKQMLESILRREDLP